MTLSWFVWIYSEEEIILFNYCKLIKVLDIWGEQ